MSELSFTTSSGRVVLFEPAPAFMLDLSDSQAEKESRARGDPLDVPTYQVETVGGVFQTLTLDEKSLQTDDQKEQWKNYQSARARLEAEQSERRTNIILSCLKIDLPDDPSWERRQKFLKMVVPEDPEEKRMHYIKTEVVRTVQDLYTAMDCVISSTVEGVVDRAAVDAARKSFRSTVQNAAQSAFSKSAGVEAVSSSSDPVAALPESSGDPHSIQVGDDPKPVSRPRSPRSSRNDGVRRHSQSDG